MFFELLSELISRAWLLLSHVTGKSGFPDKLSAEEEGAAIARMLAGDAAARALLIEHNLRLAAHIAKKYQRSGIDQDDLVSIGTVGLIKAVGSFKPEGGRLATYAARCIENEILMALRANRKTKANVSLNVPIGSDRDGNEVMLADVLGTEQDAVHDEAATAIEANRALGALTRLLDERERMVVVLRYGLYGGAPQPQHEVARSLGISRSYVSRIEKRALAKLRSSLSGE